MKRFSILFFCILLHIPVHGWAQDSWKCKNSAGEPECIVTSVQFRNGVIQTTGVNSGSKYLMVEYLHSNGNPGSFQLKENNYYATMDSMRGTEAQVLTALTNKRPIAWYGTANSAWFVVIGKKDAPITRDTIPQESELLSFDNPGDWDSNQADVSVKSIDGRTALEVTGQGWLEIDSRTFSTSELGTVNDKLSVDIYLPVNQVNPYYTGAFAAHATCPSANVQNQWIGQVELTGLSTGEFHTISMNLPSDVKNALQGDHSDCTLKLIINTGENYGSYYLDNLSFE